MRPRVLCLRIMLVGVVVQSQGALGGDPGIASAQDE